VSLAGVVIRYDPELEAILAPLALPAGQDGAGSDRGWKEVRAESELDRSVKP
jgi:hypothetical protein